MTRIEELTLKLADGLLSDEEGQELDAFLTSGPDADREYCALLRLEGELLGWRDPVEVTAPTLERLEGLFEQTEQAVMARLDELDTAQASTAPVRGAPRRLVPALLGVLATVAAAVLVVMWWTFPPALTAAAELDWLLASSSVSRDRSYRIHDLDPGPERPEERQPPIDGATLHVRYPNQYVLVRQFPDGRRFVTGSDGERSWSVPPGGAVRVSGDPMRFRGPVPGHQHGIPFADLRSDLVQISDAYSLSALEQRDALRGLLAKRKPTASRGPKELELWYDPRALVIRRMVFRGLPQARGGPNSVSIELIEQRDLGSNFFAHYAHHAPNRRIIEED